MKIIALVSLPLKQGLKHKNSTMTNSKLRWALVSLPLKQGLKHGIAYIDIVNVIVL